MHVCYLLCWLRGVAQSLQVEILLLKGMLRVSNTARAYTAPMHAENTLIFWFIASKWVMLLF